MDEQEIKKTIEEALKKDRRELATAIGKVLGEVKSKAEFRKAEQAIRALISTNIKNKDQQKELQQIADKQIKTYQDLYDASGDLEEAFLLLSKKTKLSSSGQGIFAKQMAEGVKAGGKFGKALYQGSGTIADYTSAFEDFGGVFGFALADLGKRFSTNVEAFRQLSDVGAAFNQNLVQLRQAAASAGLPLADFTDLVGKNADNLAALYGSTTLGAQAFANLSDAFRKTSIERLAPLGFTVEELNETLLTTLLLQRRSGQFNRMSTDQQIQSATALAEQMDRLAKLTGQSRQAMTKQMEAQLSNERFLAALGDMTDEARNRMSAFAAAVGTAAPGLAEGFQDLIANAGVPVTEASRTLIQNIPEASSIIRDLQAGTITTGQAMVALRDAAKRSNESLRGVAKTGTVEFARMFGEVNKLATAQLDLNAVTAEQQKRNDSLTKQLTMFEDAAKKASAGFQAIETGFFATMGQLLGGTGSMINTSLKGIGTALAALPAPMQAMLFMGKTVTSYLLDASKQIGIHAAGTAAGIRMAGGLTGITGTQGPMGRMGGIRGVAGRAGLFGLGATGLMGSMYGASSAETGGMKALSVLGGAASGAAMGSLFGPYGAVIGAILGAGTTLLSATGAKSKDKRDSGTRGKLGLSAEPVTKMLQIESGERVLSRSETQRYNQNENVTAQFTELTTQLTSKFDTMVAAMNKNTSLNEQAVKALNTQVALTAQGNKTLDRTRKGVAEMGSLV